MADAVVVIAGMEGALASVVGGLTPAPVVAVPTSTGYGAALEGVTALLAMLVLLLVGHHGRGHRQRLRRGLRDRPAPAMTEPAQRPRPSPGSTASPASPATWRWARSSTPGPTSARSAPSSSASTLPGWELQVEDGLRGGIACTRVVVEGDDVVVRTHAAIAGLIEDAALPPRVTERSLAVFGALATVEAALHRRPVEQVHFHEVGGHDAIVDIVGTASALEVLGVDVVTASPVATGTGSVRSAHGLLPNPAPATVRLLEGVPTYGRDVPRRAHDTDRRRTGLHACARRSAPCRT